jgi:hypothetical protein
MDIQKSLNRMVLNVQWIYVLKGTGFMMDRASEKFQSGY